MILVSLVGNEGNNRIKAPKPGNEVHIPGAVKEIKRKASKELNATDDIGNKTVSSAISVAYGSAKIYVATYKTLNDLKHIKQLKATTSTPKFHATVSKKIGTNFVKAGIKTAVNAVSENTVGSFSNSEDLGCQTIALGIKTAETAAVAVKTAPKVIKYSARGVKTAVNVGVKTGQATVNAAKGVKTAAKIIKSNGLKKGGKQVAQRGAKKAGEQAVKAAKAAVKLAIRLVKALGKAIIPIVVLILLFIMFSMTGTIVTFVGGILSPFFDDASGNAIDETVWLTNKVTAERTVLVNNVTNIYNNNLKANGGNYEYVRFFNSFSDAELELNDTNILTSMYSVDEYLEYIQPIFHTITLSEYQMEPSTAEMDALFDEIWNKLSTIKTEILPVEYCQMIKTDNADGTYTITPVYEPDMKVHADLTNCPNHSVFLHHPDNVNDLKSVCDYDYYVCNSHAGGCTHSCNNDCAGGCTHSHSLSCYLNGCDHVCDSGCDTYCGHSCSSWNSPSDPGCHSTTTHSGNLNYNCGGATKHRGCNGYYECLGHHVLAVSIELGTFNDLIKEYFTDEIDLLESKAVLTPVETIRLNDLNDYLIICENYITVLQEEFGVGGGSVVDLNGVTLTQLTDYACSFVGKPYVWGGNNPNTGADCSGFVRYVFNNFGVSLPRVSHDQVTQGVTIANIDSAQAGDLIFWSHDGTDSGVYHVAIYLGNGKIVHASNSKPYPHGGIKISNVYGTIYRIKRIAH